MFLRALPVHSIIVQSLREDSSMYAADGLVSSAGLDSVEFSTSIGRDSGKLI